jgi:hypothetical protein
MKVYVLFSDDYYKNIEGIYTEEGKLKKDEELYNEAIQRRAKVNEQLTSEIVELKELRQPYITEAELLLDTEKEAKEANNTGALKNTRKQRKVLLKQADHLTFDIRRREEKILASQRITKSEIMSTYGSACYWEEQYLLGEE